MKIEINKTYKVKKGHERICGAYNMRDGAFVRVTDVISNDHFHYNILDSQQKEVTQCFGCFSANDLEPVKKTLENLEVGDILKDEDGYEYMVLGVCGRVYHLSEPDDFDTSAGSFTAKELKESGFKYVKSEEDDDEEDELDAEAREAIDLLTEKGLLKDGKILKS